MTLNSQIFFLRVYRIFLSFVGKIKGTIKAEAFLIHCHWRYRKLSRNKKYEILSRYTRYLGFLNTKEQRKFDLFALETIAEISNTTGIPQHEVREIWTRIIGDK